MIQIKMLKVIHLSYVLALIFFLISFAKSMRKLEKNISEIE